MQRKRTLVAEKAFQLFAGTCHQLGNRLANPSDGLRMLVRAEQTLRIVDLVGQHVQLKRTGRNWVGLCPFHAEKSGSFNVREETGRYKCFGCDQGGNAFTFLMEIEGKSFREAPEQLAARAGLRSPLESASPLRAADCRDSAPPHGASPRRGR